MLASFHHLRKFRQPALLVALVASVFLLGLVALADGDVWWHLAAGREMWRTGSLLSQDPFSVSAAGRPWVDVHWLFQLAVYGMHCLGGVKALVISKSLLLACGSALIFATFSRGSGRRVQGLLVFLLPLALFFVRDQLQLRPLVLTLLFCSLFWFELERFRTRPSARLLWTLPLTQLLWANVQGLFVLGPFLVFAHALGAAAWLRFGTRRWFPFSAEVRDRVRATTAARLLGLTLPLCLLACLVTPFGTRGAALPSLLLSRLLPESGNVFSANVAENVPPFASAHLLPGQFLHLQLFFLLSCLTVLLATRRLRLSQLSIFAGLSVLALMANRNVVLLYWLGTPILCVMLVPALSRARCWLAQRRLPRFAPVAYALVAMPLLLAASAAAREPSLTGPAPFRVPELSAERIAKAAGNGAVFAADSYGGYLIWRLYPEHRPYIDTRLVLRSAAEYSEYLGLLDEPSRFDAFQQRHQFDFVVLPTAFPDRYLGLIAHLYRDRQWKLVFTDGSEVLFVRRAVSQEPALDLGSREVSERIVSALDRRYAGATDLLLAARIQFATLELSLAHFAEADWALAGVSAPEAESLRARCRLAQGDAKQARELSLRALERSHDDVPSLNLLALSSLSRGESKQAVALLRRALTVDPFDAEAARILSSMEDLPHVESP
jgi:tetratricopeptide (TPR) repeat protein